MGIQLSLVGKTPVDTRDPLYISGTIHRHGVTRPVPPRYSDLYYQPRHQSSQGSVYITPYAYNVNSGRFDNEVTNFQTFGAENVTTGWAPQHNTPDSGAGLIADSTQAKPGLDGHKNPYGFWHRQMYMSGPELK